MVFLRKREQKLNLDSTKKEEVLINDMLEVEDDPIQDKDDKTS